MPLIAGLKYWSDDVYSERPTNSYAYYAGVYASLQISGLISLLLLGIIIFIVVVKKAGANLHRDTLRTLIRAPLRFFTATDTGVVTNLFSQDLNIIDTELPNALLNTLFCVSLRCNWTEVRIGIATRLWTALRRKPPSLTSNFQIFQAIGQAAVILTSSPYMAVSYPFLAALLYIVQRFYLRTSRQLRLLDLETKSPL